MIIKAITKSFIFPVVLSAFLFSSNLYADSITSIGLDVGPRSDDVSFTIAGDINGNNPNILSELTWTNLRSHQKKISVENISNGNIVKFSISDSSIISGSNQDSDYAGDNRTFEFSRSYNATHGDDVKDREIGFGHQFDAYDQGTGNTIYIVPMVGLSYHEQNLRMTSGNQVIQLFPSLITQPFSGLNSTYNTEWEGKWLGVQFWFAGKSRQDKFSLLFKHHWSDYNAVANWNLRTDFMHPVSFEHAAKGTGNEFLIEWTENISEPLALKLSFQHQKWSTDPGIDIVYLSSGAVASTRLNNAEWKSTVFSIGIELRI